ncbi:MAG: site-specific integrase [Fuerstiella sp.]
MKSVEVPAKGYSWWYDDGCPNLALRVSHTGRKTFVLCGSNGKRKVIPAEDLGVARAYCRRKADEAAVADSGLIGEWTLQTLFDHWMEFRSKPHKRTWKRDLTRFRACLLPWADRKLGEIRQIDVVGWHVALGKDRGHYSANDSLVFLSSLFVYAAGPALGYLGPNPCKGIQRFPEQSRERYLTPDEVVRFFDAVELLSREISRDFLKLAIFTGQRRQRVLEMRWDQLDLEGGLWFIDGGDNKSKRDQIVSLASPAVDVLLRRKENSIDGIDWVLPSSQSPTGHYNDPKTAWAAVLKRSGLKNLVIHDLRRTLGSWMANGGENLEVIGKALGHRSREATAIYARLSGEPVRAAVERAAVAIDEKGKAR